jgi:asparagine synthase (glutamine-hydrolysing)
VPIANNIFRLFKNFSFLKNILPGSNNKKSLYNYFYRLLSMSGKEGLSFYISATNDIFEDYYKFRENNIINKADDFIKKIFTKKSLTDLSRILYLDFTIILFSDLLIKMDIATMTNSLEGRSPFLSKYILEFAPMIPDNLKINNFSTKFILRKLGRKYLHPTLLKQPKRGFEVPLKKWVKHDLKENIFDTLQQGCYSEKFIKRDFIDKLLHNKIGVSEEKRAKMIWTMFCLEIWRKNL